MLQKWFLVIGVGFLPQFKNFFKQIHSTRADSNAAWSQPQGKIQSHFRQFPQNIAICRIPLTLQWESLRISATGETFPEFNTKNN